METNKPLTAKTALKAKTRLKASTKLKKRKKAVYLKAHDLAREIWRLRGYCEDCGRAKGTLKANGRPIQLQGAHIFGVGVYNRLGSDLRNGICLCAACHMKWTNNPDWKDFVMKHPISKYYSTLQRLALKRERVDWLDRIEFLKEIRKAIMSGEMTVEEAWGYEPED